MAIGSKAYLTYALNKEGNLVHVDKVPNGNECGCVCPHCKSALCAKNGGDGEKMIHHFAHLSGADCVGAVESALHKMAKDVLSESKCVFLPNRFDGRLGEQHRFDRVEVEFYDKDTRLRPDCIGYNEDKSLWIEFKRTHAVDAKKRGKIISAHIDCIEIDLNGCSLDPVAVKEFIMNSVENRKWIRDISVSNRKAGHASGSGSCDRYDDYYDEYRRLNRTFAKDENGQLVNLRDDMANMNEHSYYCLACGKELTIDVDDDGSFLFTHVDEQPHCEDDLYLHEAAKEIIYAKFYASKGFLISIPQHLSCCDSSSCTFYNQEECVKDKHIPYDLKKHGYVECLKDYMFPNTKYKCDLVIKRADTFDQAIIISIDAGSCHVDVTSLDNRIVELEVYNEKSLMTLQDNAIGEGRATFLNFKKNNSGTVDRTEIDRGIEKFELFSSGKYHLDIVSCSEINNRKRSTVCEIIFAEQTMGLYEAKIYSLLKCYQKKRKACYCELCFFLSEVNSYGLTEKICRRYKTKGTPQYPIREAPIDCEYFSLNRTLVANIERDPTDVTVIEREFEPI